MKMRIAIASGILSLCGWASIHAQEVDHPSAVEAMASLPPGAKENIAAVIGYEGKPTPDRWRFIVWDSSAENGFREYVVFDGRLTARNAASQFATIVTPGDQISGASLRIDSAKVAWLALQYAKANNLKVASLNYELRRTSTEPAFWKVDCYDSQDQPVGSISIAADEGNVLARSGLPKEPTNTAPPKSKPTPAVRPPREQPRVPGFNDPRRVARQETTAKPPPEAIAEDADRTEATDESEPVQVRRAEPVSRRSRPFSIGRVVRSILPF